MDLYSFGYNAFGQRVSKSYSYLEGMSGPSSIYVGQVLSCSKQFRYDHAGRLISETIAKNCYGTGEEDAEITFVYDGNTVIGMEYTVDGLHSYYYFHRNPLGDVVGIYNLAGTLVAKYNYDAWGNCTISSETTDYTIANANPIRYRGYYYDDDTGLYYLNARYYSPKWRRFISPDDTAYLDPESVNGLNLYCYCGNDPVNYADPSGRGPITALLLTALLAGALSAGANVLGQIVFDGKTLETLDWRKVAISGAAGFCAGLIPGTRFISIAGQAVVSSFVENGLSAIWLDEEFEIVYVIQDSIVSLATGYAMKGISHLTSKLTSKIFHKAPNYSQYQHYFRQKGHDYSRQEVYKYMRRHMRYKGITDDIVDSVLDFSFSFLTYPL